LSFDPNDLEPLTPPHFLIGRLLTAGLPQRYLEDTTTNRLVVIVKACSNLHSITVEDGMKMK